MSNREAEISDGTEALATATEPQPLPAIPESQQALVVKGFLFCPYCGESLGYEPTEVDALFQPLIDALERVKEYVEKSG